MSECGDNTLCWFQRGSQCVNAFPWPPVPTCAVALCKDVTVAADSSCTASGTATSIDNGSKCPPEDKCYFLLQHPPPPYRLGSTSVTLSATNLFSPSVGTCSGIVTVVDNGCGTPTPTGMPTFTAILTPTRTPTLTPTRTPTRGPGQLSAQITTNRGCGDSAVFTVGDSIVATLIVGGDSVSQVYVILDEVLPDGGTISIDEGTIYTNRSYTESGTAGLPTGLKTLQLAATAGSASVSAECSFHVRANGPTPTNTPMQTQTPGATPPCVGDCNGSTEVAVNELVTLVSIALGNADASTCSRGIPTGLNVDISLIVRAVTNALAGCSS